MSFDYSQYSQLAFASISRIREVQEDMFRRHLAYTVNNSPYYRDLLADRGFSMGKVSLADLPSLPLTDKYDFSTHNEAFQAVSCERIVDIVFSSGTSGVPTRIVYTEADLRRLAYNEHQSFAAVGVDSSDSVLLTCTMDRCFIAGLAYFLGLRSLGAAVIRNGHGTLAGHLAVIDRVAPTVLVGVPSFLLKLGRYLISNRRDPAGSSVRSLVCIGEPVRDHNMDELPVCRRLLQLWGASVHSTYASSEIVSSFCECTAQCGGHLLPELAVVEIVDDEGVPVAVGESGEVVVTPLGVEGMPLLRFRTGDISFLIDSACSCGRNSVRLGPISARKDQMLKVRGTTVYPSAIAATLDLLPAVEDHYIEVTQKDRLSDQVTVHVSVTDPSCQAALIEEQLQARLRVKLPVSIESTAYIREQVYSPHRRKPMRFHDRRSQG